MRNGGGVGELVLTPWDVMQHRLHHTVSCAHIRSAHAHAVFLQSGGPKPAAAAYKAVHVTLQHYACFSSVLLPSSLAAREPAGTGG